MGDKYYAFEKFSSAVRLLAVNDGPRRGLLRDAYSSFSPIIEKDLPDSAVESFREIERRLNAAEDTTGEGTVPATLRLLDVDEARSIAGLIVDVHGWLARAIFDAQKTGERFGAHHPDTAVDEDD